MITFKCPVCRAEVTKEAGSELGCPCCGYAQDMATPGPPNYFPWWGIYPPWGQEQIQPPAPWVPFSPWSGTGYTGDQIIITTTSDSTISYADLGSNVSSSNIYIDNTEDYQFSWTN